MQTGSFLVPVVLATLYGVMMIPWQEVVATENNKVDSHAIIYGQNVNSWNRFFRVLYAFGLILISPVLVYRMEREEAPEDELQKMAYRSSILKRLFAFAILLVSFCFVFRFAREEELEQREEEE